MKRKERQTACLTFGEASNNRLCESPRGAVFYDTDIMVSRVPIAAVCARWRNFSLSAALPCSTETPNPSVKLAIILICAAAGYFFGMIFGIDYACSPPAGNLCGLAGVLVIGPLSSAVAIIVIGSLILLLPRDK